MVPLAAAGCVSPLATSLPEASLRDDARYRLVDGLSMPRVRGPEGCGAAALAAVVTFGGPRDAAQALAEDLPWQDRGATPVDLLLEARSRGVQARIARGTWESLREEVDLGRPALVMIDAAYELLFAGRLPLPRVMHWAVVSGMATDGSKILLAARPGRHHVLSRRQFLRRWARSDNCLITVRPP
jgi:predicted double-glycine peptidase